MTDKRVEAAAQSLWQRWEDPEGNPGVSIREDPRTVAAFVLAAADAADTEHVRVPREEFEQFVSVLSDGHQYALTDWARCMLAGEKYEPED